MRSRKNLGIILGDHAGIGPETVIKALLASKKDYNPILIGNREIFEKTYGLVTKECLLPVENISLDQTRNSVTDENVLYFFDIPVGSDIDFGQISFDSGKLVLESIYAAVKLERAGLVDGLVMAPITKKSLHLVDDKFKSEFELFAQLYNVRTVKAVIMCGNIYRCTVVGHCAFSEIIKKLTIDSIESTGRELLRVMRLLKPSDDCRIAIAALNPHAGEDGLFGDEEARIITPAINTLKAEGEDVIGPCPADTVYLKARNGEVNGIVYLYHDQGNIAMKSGSFGEAVLVYTQIPAKIVSVGHGSALDIAGKNQANAENLIASIEVLLQIVRDTS